MRRRTILKYGAGAALGSALAACGGGGGGTPGVPGDNGDQFHAVMAWNDTALQAVRTTRPGPPMAARSMAVLHTAIYDAWAAYDAVALGTQLGGTLRRPAAERTAQNRMIAISEAAHAALLDQYPSQKSAFDAQIKALGLDAGVAAAGAADARQTGAAAAQACIDACHVDGANQLGGLTPSGVPYADYTGYAPRNPPLTVTLPTALSDIPDPDHWQPLRYQDASGNWVAPGFVAACWSQVRPFAMQTASQLRPGPPARYGTPEYEAQARDIIAMQMALTEQQKAVADYWADIGGSVLPPGHWHQIARFVAQRDGLGEDASVKLFFALSNALSDAAIAAWDAKRAYDSERPITAIRRLMHGSTIAGYGPGGAAAGLMPIPGETWVPFQPLTFPTPPFAEHISGHSTFSAAAAEVLLRFTGSDAYGGSHIVPARSLQVDPSLPAQDLTLSWATFSDAATEAGMSRLYGGIHFAAANLAGQSVGRQVGALAFAKAQSYWLGQG